MFSRIRGFLTRHRRKFIFGGVIIGGFILLSRYTQRKLREWQEKEIKEMLEKTRRRQYFESTERSCNQMILSLAANLRESIIRILDTTAIVNKLRSGSINKVSLWNELKVLAITRSAVIIYAQVMFVVLVRIQFNLVAGYMYNQSQEINESIKENGELQTKYMSLCGYFLNEGVEKLCTLVQGKVKEITTAISLADQLSLRDLEQIYWSIMSSITADSNRDPVKNLAQYVLPPNCEDDSTPLLSKIIQETLDLLESNEVQDFTQSNIRSGFVLLIDHISEFYSSSSRTADEDNKKNGISIPGTSKRDDTPWTDSVATQVSNRSTVNFVDINKVTIHMARIIPIINGQVPDQPMPRDVPTEWLQRLILNDELKMFGANIYEAFSF